LLSLASPVFVPGCRVFDDVAFRRQPCFGGLLASFAKILGPERKAELDPTLLARYEMVAHGTQADLPKNAAVFNEKSEFAPMDGSYSGPLVVGLGNEIRTDSMLIGPLAEDHGTGVSFVTKPDENLFELASGPSIVNSIRAYRLAHDGQTPVSYAEVLPYSVDAEATRRLSRLKEIEATATKDSGVPPSSLRRGH